MRIFRKGLGPHALPVAMSGIRMGERLLTIGSGTPGMFAAMAAKVGLSGRACAMVLDEAGAAALGNAAAREGVLAEIDVSPLDRLPFEDAAFDLVVLDATGSLAALGGAEWEPCLRESQRVLRAGGRALLIQRTGQRGFRTVLAGRASSTPALPAADVLRAFGAAGFRAARELAEREGLRFIEAIKLR